MKFSSIKTASFFLLIPLILTLSGCESMKSKPPLKPQQESQTVENEDGVLEFTFLGEDFLTQVHGSRDNPFLPPPITLTPYRFYVFNVRITAKKDMSISLRHTLLRVGSKNFQASTRDSLLNMWKVIDEDYAYKKYDSRKKEEAVKRHLLPEEFVLYASETISGYCVFAGQLPLSDKLRITIPVTSLSEGVTERLNVEYQF